MGSRQGHAAPACVVYDVCVEEWWHIWHSEAVEGWYVRQFESL